MESKTNYEGWKIQMGWLAGNLFDGWDIDGIDISVSEDKYENLVISKLEAAFDGASITIITQDGSGSLPYACQTRVFSPDEKDTDEHAWLCHLIDQITEGSYETSDQWVVNFQYMPA